MMGNEVRILLHQHLRHDAETPKFHAARSQKGEVCMKCNLLLHPPRGVYIQAREQFCGSTLYSANWTLIKYLTCHMRSL